MSAKIKTIQIVYFEAASGHLSAAKAIEAALKQANSEWNVSCVDVIDLLQHHTVFQKIVTAGIHYFNFLLTREALSDLPGLIRLSVFVQGQVRASGHKKIARFWENKAPDILISVTPMYNEVMFRSLKQANPTAKYITIPVDFEESRERYWFTPSCEDILYLNAKEKLMKQAKQAGISDKRSVRIGGMVITPEYYDYAENTDEREKKLVEMGLNPAWPVVTVSYGGQGSVIVKKIARQIQKYTQEINVIFLCGKNESVFDWLISQQFTYKKAVLGYQKETPVRYIQLSDVVIGKPGAMTITENMISKKPSLLIKSTGLHFVQQCNEQWVEEKQVGIVLKKMKDLPEKLHELLTNPVYKQQCELEFHKGIFDVAEEIVDRTKV